MKWSLLICPVLIILVSYFLIKKIENSLHRPSVLPGTEPTLQEVKPLALIFGFSELADKLITLFQNHSIEYIQIEDQSQLDKTKDYTHLFALSSSDLENLLINTLVNRINNTHKKIAICNSTDNMGIYKLSDFISLINDNLDAELLFKIMFPSDTDQ